MSRFVVASALVSLVAFSAAGCSKSAARQEAAGGAQPSGGGQGQGKIAVPGGDTVGAGGPATGGPEGEKRGAADESRLRLLPEEGQLAVQAPADAKANSEATATITVTAGKEFKLNTEFPTKVSIETPSGVTVAKAELKAGGHDKAKGDAEVFDEQTLTFAIKMTPTAGTHTVNGTFKFAVCDKAGTTCLAKKEPITIQLAAK